MAVPLPGMMPGATGTAMAGTMPATLGGRGLSAGLAGLNPPTCWGGPPLLLGELLNTI